MFDISNELSTKHIDKAPNRVLFFFKAICDACIKIMEEKKRPA